MPTSTLVKVPTAPAQHVVSLRLTCCEKPSPMQPIHTQIDLTRANGKLEKIVLLALSGAQARRASPARELCTSRWFSFARAYAESHACPWLLLSARYGLVPPHQVITPYKADLAAMSAAERREWGREVGEAAQRTLPVTRQIVLLAGVRYVKCLLPYLEEIADEVCTPLAGLTVGYQCGWLRCNTRPLC